MGTAISRPLFPPQEAHVPARGGADAWFTLLLLFVALALIWIARVHGPMFLGRWLAPLDFQSPADLGLLVAALLSAILLHELGHLLAALGLGFNVLGGSLGPFQIQVLHGQWKVLFEFKRSFTASVSAVPAGLQHWRAALLIVVGAGPVATLGGALALAAIPLSGHEHEFFQLCFVQISLLIFALGLIPNSRRAGVRNDARLFLDLLLRNAGAEEMALYVMLMQEVITGTSAQDYPPALLGRLAGWHGRPESEFVFAGALFRWALDAEEIEVADAWDTRILKLAEACGARSRNKALASSGCFDVLFRNDLEAARLKFEGVNFGALFPPCFEHLARAAQQVALGRYHRAPGEIIRGQYALPRGMAAYQLERRLLARLHMMVLGRAAKRFQAASA